jgi:phosphonate transport system substrate-binding protein
LQRAIAFLYLTAAVVFAPALQAAQAPLVIGVFPRLSATETTRRYTPLAEYLSKTLKREVNLVTSRDFHSFWQGIEEQRYDIVQYNQYHYIRSANAYEVIAHNKEFGKSTLAGVLYVRKDSGITKIGELRGRTVMFGGGEDAMISYITPLYMILQAGLRKDEFKSVFSVNPINSVIGVYHRQADAAGSGNGAIEQPVLKKAIDTDQLKVLAVSEELLHLPWAVRRTMPARLREAIQTALVDVESSKTGAAVLKAAVLTGIGKAEDKDYDPHRRIVRAVESAGAAQR